MRLLILTQYFAPEIGAPQARLAAIARELRVRGHAVEVVTAMPHHLAERTFPGYRGRLYVRESMDGITVHRSWVFAATGTGVRRMASYLSFTLSCLIGLMRAKRPDAIFVESPPLFLSLPGWIFARLFGARLIFNVADLWPDSVRELGVLRGGPLLRAAELLERWTYARAAVVNAATDGIASVLRERKGVHPRKIVPLPNGIDVARFTPRPPDEVLVRDLGLEGRPVVLYAGTHGIAQGLLGVLEAAEELGDDALLLCIGAGPVKAAMQAFATQRGLHNVRFLAPVPLDEMPRYLSLARASIVPLVRTPLMASARPSKIFPSLACGVPVIYSGEGESAALIERAQAGLVVPPEDPPALAQAIRRIVRDDALRARLAMNARNLAVERFAWSAIVGTWLAALANGSPGLV
ncbi:MAG: glycosyltransferase family 4 protein [bacterium]|nr:glycosyltransferase family 4 protein [bacterium]